MNRPPRGDIYRRNNVHLEMFMVTAQMSPNLTVKIKEGSTWIDGKFVEYLGGNSKPFEVPVGGAKWVLVSIDSQGIIRLTDGEVSINPNNPPELNINEMPLALVFMEENTEFITSDMIYDVRPVMDSYYIVNHNQIKNRTEENSHPISAITNLTNELSIKVNHVELDNAVESLARKEGTTASEFTLNMDFTGTPSTDAILWVKRGNQMDVGIRWNETADRFEFTDDGINWVPLAHGGAVQDASVHNKGIVKLNVSPLQAHNPIVVGVNDPLYLSISNKSNIGHKHDPQDLNIPNIHTEFYEVTQELLNNKEIILEKLPVAPINLGFSGAPVQLENASFTREGKIVTLSNTLIDTIKVGDKYQAQYWTLE